MSQVRKLLKGQNIPKAQDGYKFTLDSQDVYFTDDDLKEIDKKISLLPMDYRRFLGNATTAIKTGNQSGNRAENTVTMDQLSNLGKSDVRRLEKQKGTYLEALIRPDSYSAKGAINAYLNILSSVANKTTQKPKISNSDLQLVFNGEKGNYGLSTTAGNNYAAKTRILNLLDSVNADNYGYDVSDWDLGWLPGWMASLPGEDKKQAAKDYVDALWTRMASGYNPEVNPDDLNFLRNFKIGYGFNTNDNTSDDASKGSGETTDFVKEDGSIDDSIRNSNGSYPTKSDENGILLTNAKEGDSKPYLLSSPERLARFNLGPEYLDSVLYQGKIYKPSQVTPEINLDLYNRMQDVIRANNSIKNPTQLSEKLSSLIDYTDYDTSLYGYYNPEENFWDNAAIRQALGRVGNYGVFNATQAYDVEPGGSIFGLYDYNTPGTEQWGFRAPFYLIVNPDGSLEVSTDGTPRFNEIPDYFKQKPNTEYGAAPGYSDWTPLYNNKFGLVRTIPAAEASRQPYPIYEDFDGNWYYNNSSRGLIKIQQDLKDAILGGYRPHPREMETGTLDPKLHANAGGGSRKNGGLIPLKPLPQKFQKGSVLLTKGQASPQEQVTDIHDPLSSSVKLSDATSAESFWNSLSSAEKKEIIATSIDLGGAVAGLAGPVGSVAGAVTGLGSTGLFMNAAKERKGSLDWTDYGQAALSTLLDVVSVLPWVGEAGKVAKIGSKLQKVAAPIGKIFTLMGLSEAATVITKPMKEWTTDDLVKLSSGLQAVTNISSGIRVGRGESRLAARLSANAEAPKAHTYGNGKYKRNVNGVETPVTLDEHDVRAITTSDSPDGVLRRLLTGEKYNIKAEDLPSDGKVLLEEFGFDVSNHRAIREKNRHLVAQEKPEQKPEKFSKYDYLLDPFRITSNPEMRRRAYIDATLASNPKLVKELGPRATSSSTITTPRETITTRHIESPLDRSERRAYISSLTRMGMMRPGTWQFRTPIDQGLGEQISVERSTLDAAEKAAGFNGYTKFGEEGPFHAMATERAKDLSGLYADAAKDDLIYSVRAATKPENKPRASRASNLRAEGISNKDLQNYISQKQLSESDAIEFINGLSERKKQSLLSSLRNSKSEKIQSILSHFETPVQSAMRKVYSTPSMTDVIGRNAVRRTQRKTERTAKNIELLKNSNDPMKTLREITEKDSNFAQQVMDNQEEFQAALNFALSRMPKGRKSKYSKNYRDYIDELYGFLDKNNLVIFTKKGGIIKALDGTKLWESDDWVNPTNNPNAFKQARNIFSQVWGDNSHGDPLPVLNDNWHTPTFSDARDIIADTMRYTTATSATTPVTPTVQSETTQAQVSPRVGGNIARLGNWYRSAIPILSSLRLASLNSRNNKYIDALKRSAEKSKSNWIAPDLHAPILDNSAYERQLQAIREERMTNSMSPTSDIIVNNALKNQRDAQLYQRENSIWSGINQNTVANNAAKVEVQNQLSQNRATVTNHNSDSHAAAEAAKEQGEAQRQLLLGKNFDNFLYEIEHGVSKDIELLKSGRVWQLGQNHDKELQDFYASNASSELSLYNALPQDEKLKYMDFGDYLQRVYPDKYNEIREALEEIQKRQLSEKAEMEFGSTTYLPYRVDESPVVRKKGGLLRGNTRYKNEPDEQVWIDSNKAVHAAIAKLQDNTIKLLLRALK